MITAKDIRNKRFEKAAFGYKQEEIDEFLAQLESEIAEMEAEMADSNNKIQILADKVREYMKDEDALKDALLGAQKQGHKVIAEANEKAEAIIAEAQTKADALIDEATKQHDAAMEKNRLEIEHEKEALIAAQQQVSDFKKSLFDMYKSHLELISSMPESFDDEDEQQTAESIIAKNDAEEIAEKVAAGADSQLSAKTIKNAYESRFGDLKFGQNGQNPEE